MPPAAGSSPGPGAELLAAHLPAPANGLAHGAKGRALGLLTRLRGLPVLSPVARAIPPHWQTRVKSWLRG